jgi:hypothetical protein
MAVDVIPSAEPASWLFVEDAAGGTLTGPDDQHLKLKLKKVRKNITAITDGPIPQADALTNEEFFTAWPQMFADEPPTAVLSYDLPGKSQPPNIILTLTNPQYDSVKRTVEFDAVRVRQAPHFFTQSPPSDQVIDKTPHQLTDINLNIVGHVTVTPFPLAT